MKILIFVTILGVSLAACERNGSSQQTADTADTEGPATHLGGCILLEPNRQAPDDLYTVSNVVATDEIAPFSKMLLVNGLTLAARDEISDEFMTLVAKTIAEIFPRNPDLDLEMQARVIENHYRYGALIPVPKGEDFSFMEDNQDQWAVLESQYSICDIIMQDVPGQVMEVVEHILHYVTDIGLHYAYPDVWGISETSQLAAAMQKAVDMGYYEISSYDDIDEPEVRNRVELQEFAYWFVSTAWNLQADYGPVWESEWNITDREDLQEKLPEFFAAYEQTVDRVMVAPSLETLAMIGPTRADERSSLIAYTTFTESGPEIWLVGADGNGARRVGPGSDASWSPDGDRLVFTLEVDGNVDVYHMDLEGGDVTRLTHDESEDSRASWSPDGTMIAFNSDRSGSDQVWRSNVDAGEWGYNLTQLTEDTHHNRVNNFLSWSPDGRWIAFEADRDRDDPEIYLANAVDGSNQQRLTFTRALDEVPSWSPSGDEILFSSDMHDEPQSGTYDIYIMNVDGSAQRRLTTTPGAASYPSMSADGKKIVYSYQPGREGPMDIWIMNSDGSEAKLLLEGGGIPRFSPF